MLYSCSCMTTLFIGCYTVQSHGPRSSCVGFGAFWAPMDDSCSVTWDVFNLKFALFFSLILPVCLLFVAQRWWPQSFDPYKNPKMQTDQGRGLNLMAWNVRVLNHPIKKKKTMTFIYKWKRCDVVFLQEKQLQFKCIREEVGLVASLWDSVS